MTAANVKNYIKSHMPEAEVIVGGINADRERCIGIYDAQSTATSRRCIGDKRNTRYQSAKYRIAIQWTDSAVAAQRQAQAVRALFDHISNVDMDGVPVISSSASPPSWGGREPNRACVYVLQVTIQYKEDTNHA